MAASGPEAYPAGMARTAEATDPRYTGTSWFQPNRIGDHIVGDEDNSGFEFLSAFLGPISDHHMPERLAPATTAQPLVTAYRGQSLQLARIVMSMTVKRNTVWQRFVPWTPSDELAVNVEVEQYPGAPAVQVPDEANVPRISTNYSSRGWQSYNYSLGFEVNANFYRTEAGRSSFQYQMKQIADGFRVSFIGLSARAVLDSDHILRAHNPYGIYRGQVGDRGVEVQAALVDLVRNIGVINRGIAEFRKAICRAADSVCKATNEDRSSLVAIVPQGTSARLTFGDPAELTYSLAGPDATKTRASSDAVTVVDRVPIYESDEFVTPEGTSVQSLMNLPMVLGDTHYIGQLYPGAIDDYQSSSRYAIQIPNYDIGDGVMTTIQGSDCIMRSSRFGATGSLDERLHAELAAAADMRYARNPDLYGDVPPDMFLYRRPGPGGGQGPNGVPNTFAVCRYWGEVHEEYLPDWVLRDFAKTAARLAPGGDVAGLRRIFPNSAALRPEAADGNPGNGFEGDEHQEGEGAPQMEEGAGMGRARAVGRRARGPLGGVLGGAAAGRAAAPAAGGERQPPSSAATRWAKVTSIGDNETERTIIKWLLRQEINAVSMRHWVTCNISPLVGFMLERPNIRWEASPVVVGIPGDRTAMVTYGHANTVMRPKDNNRIAFDARVYAGSGSLDERRAAIIRFALVTRYIGGCDADIARDPVDALNYFASSTPESDVYENGSVLVRMVPLRTENALPIAYSLTGDWPRDLENALRLREGSLRYSQSPTPSALFYRIAWGLDRFDSLATPTPEGAEGAFNRLLFAGDCRVAPPGEHAFSAFVTGSGPWKGCEDRGTLSAKSGVDLSVLVPKTDDDRRPPVL